MDGGGGDWHEGRVGGKQGQPCWLDELLGLHSRCSWKLRRVLRRVT